ncbi:MAG: dockerin type I repeat-containing protein [candidate division Zixibacteria bacterium]|nr:dockerin type I repeat-containing protein [candidate division Zixibacteria bacterium]
MTRKLAAVFLLSFLVVAFMATTLTYGANKPVPRFAERASFPARFAPVYTFSGADQAAFAAPKGSDASALGQVSTEAVGLQVGTTMYDYQHNCSMGHQAEHRGTDWVHFAWMNQQGGILGEGRGGATQSYDLANCALLFQDPKVFTADYGGYVNIDADQNNCPIPTAHEGADADSQRPRAYFDYCVTYPMGVFASDYPTDVYGWYANSGVGPLNQNLWPIIEWQLGGADPILHMVACESGGAAGDPQTISYYRRVGAYGSGSGTWSAQKLVDTAMNINPILAASQTTGKVAIVWNAPADYKRDQGASVEYASQYENDVWYALSSDRGASFMAVTGSIGNAVVAGTVPGANITKYEAVSPYKAYCDMAALITADENLHVVWGCRKWTDSTSLFRRQSAIFHWSENVPNIRTIVKAEWDTGGSCVMYAWGSDAAKMSIAECDGKLYMLYTQFGNATQPCYDYNTDKTVMNGELYMSASSDNGLNWDRAQNLTNSPSPQCADGDCNSDYWASMARYGRTDVNGCEGIAAGTKVLDIVYINDKSAGGCVQTESGVWVTNPVMWLATPCRDVVAEPGYMDNAATGYGECYSSVPLVVVPNGDTTFSITLENPGLLDNNFSIAMSYTDGSGWMTATPASGVIPSGLNNTLNVDLIFTAPAGASDPSVWVGKITVNHQAEGSPREIPVCLMVASSFTYPASVDLATTCKNIRLWNDAHMVNNASGHALNYISDCDTFNVNTTSQIYLYDGSPVVCRVNENSDTLRFTAYSKTFTDADGMRPLAPWTIDNSNADYTKASTRFATADTTVGFIAEYFIPTAPANCEFVVEKLRFYNMTAATLSGVLVGEFLDWDVPSDSASNNGSGFDLARGLVYQIGAEYNQDDSTEALCAQESDARYGGIAAGPGVSFKNGMTLDNATYVYTSGPYGDLAPLPPAATYEKMKNNDGFSTYSSSVPESTYTDLSTLITFGEYNLTTTDTICMVKVLATSRTGLTAFNTAIDAGKAFITSHADLVCGVLSCCNKAGDANNDNKVNVGDAVYIISYVFRGGPAPVCPAEGNANGDLTPQGANKINVGDAVYIISYVFRGGPAPVCGVGL